MVAFEIVVIVVCVVSAVIATVAFVGARRLYDQVGGSGPLSMAPDDELGDRARAQIRQEVNETLSAISALREARGEAERGSPARGA